MWGYREWYRKKKFWLSALGHLCPEWVRNNKNREGQKEQFLTGEFAE